MGVIARLKCKPRSITSGSTTYLPSECDTFIIGGSATITSLPSSPPLPGRTVTFIGATGASVTFTNTNDPTTSGQMDLGGSNRSVGAQDVLTLTQMENGTWVMSVSLVNN